MQARTLAAIAALGALAPTAASAQSTGSGERRATPLPEQIHREHNLTAAQEEELAPLGLANELPASIVDAVILHMLDGSPIAAGADYRANFDAAGMRFTPALGRHAPESQSLSFQLDSILVGGMPLPGLDLNSAPIIDVGTVQYLRSASVREVYEPRIDGLEQSFVFDELPTRQGDLVVRGRIESTAPLSQFDVTPESIRFESEGIGGVRVSKVLGLDANGDSAAGQLRVDGDFLELVLPAEFVARAALPLVLDPLFGSIVSVTDGSYNALDPDMAFGQRGILTRYGVAWERIWSATDVDIYYAELTSTGGFASGPFILEGTVSDVATNPTVGFCNQNDQFLVAWQQTTDIGPILTNSSIVCRQVFSDLSVSPVVVIADPSNLATNPDLASESTNIDNDVVIVWQESNAGIFARQISLADMFTPVPLGTATVVYSSNDASDPAISKNGGSTGYHVVVFERLFDGIPLGDHDIFARAVDRNANNIGLAISLGGTIGPDEENPDVDGNGESAVVAFDRDAFFGDTDGDIIARKLSVDASGVTVASNEIVVEADANDDERNPAIGFGETEFFIAWQDAYGLIPGFYRLSMIGYGVDDCLTCEFETFITTTGTTDEHPEISTSLSGGGVSSLSDIVFVRDPGTGTTEITYQAVDDSRNGGIAANIGGGCGVGGSISTSGGGAFLGNPDYAISLTGIDPFAAIAILNIAVNPTPFLCGTCVWNPFELTFLTTTTGGNASVPTPIPCNASYAGRVVEAQWTTLFTVGSPCPLSTNVSLSDRASITLGY